MAGSKIAHIGKPWGCDRPDVFELDLDEVLPYADPSLFEQDYEGVKPLDYFVTSGDAVEKMRVLERDIWQHAGQVRKDLHQRLMEEKGCTVTEAVSLLSRGKYPADEGLVAYEAAMWQSAGRARKLLNLLIQARGEDCFLETEWDDHRLLCIPKNPRKKND